MENMRRYLHCLLMRYRAHAQPNPLACLFRGAPPRLSHTHTHARCSQFGLKITRSAKGQSLVLVANRGPCSRHRF